MVASVLRKRTIAKVLLATATIINFALSVHVNLFMGFFYIADRLPFVFSLLTGFTLGLSTILEAAKSGDAAIVKPAVEIGLLGAFFITWTAANAYSTPRWDKIQPGVCSSIALDGSPGFESGARTWCHEILALRAFVWIEWIIIGGSLILLLVYCIKQHKRGSTHIWKTPLALYKSHTSTSEGWDPKSRVFSNLSWGVRDAGPYPFDMQPQAQTPYYDRFKTVRSQDSGPAFMGYQMDPFNVSKERPISIASSGEAAVQPASWRSFPEQAFNRSRASHQQHAYSTSVEHHHNQAYAY